MLDRRAAGRGVGLGCVLVLGLACGGGGATETGSGGSSGPGPNTSGATGTGTDDTSASSGSHSGSLTDTPTSDGPGTGPGTTAPTDTGDSADTGTTDVATTDVTTGDTGDTDLEIGECDPDPGVCPPGTTQVDLATVADLEAASRGEDAFANDGPGTCYFIKNGEYKQGDELLLYMQHGGSVEQPIHWVGESRDGVHIVGRASFEKASHVVLRNLTFDLTGYEQDGSFNTIDLGEVEDITISHVTLTGDCQTGLMGGHIETNYTKKLLVECSLIENYGHCGPDGHEDHGVYLASGSDLHFINNVIRGNASRGIQMYTQNGDYGTLDNVVIERNRILENGHGDHEDGIVINGKKTGTITDVTIRHNLIYRNYFSGIRFAGPATMGIVIEHNTFAGNGVGSDSEARSEINIDDPGMAAHAMIGGNIFAVDLAAINDCGDAQSLGFTLADNVVFGTVATGDASCVSGSVAEDPQFVDPAAGDFHPQNPAVADYGAYAP